MGVGGAGRKWSGDDEEEGQNAMIEERVPVGDGCEVERGAVRAVREGCCEGWCRRQYFLGSGGQHFVR